MTGAEEAATFLAGVPVSASFAESADPARAVPVPDGWIVGVSDVVGSTEAIEAGRYKSVNMAGAAVISGLANALAHRPFPFVFGGDGASFAVPAACAGLARDVLARTATLVAEEFGLTLRIGTVAVAAIREAGLDLRVARFAASDQVTYAMFSGGGLAFAEEELKAGRIALDRAPPGSRPDLTGLSCRFDEIPASRGLILSLIAKPAAPSAEKAFASLLRRLLSRVEASAGAARPLPDGGPALPWPPVGTGLELRTQTRPGAGRVLRRLRLGVGSLFSFAILRLGLRVGQFDPAVYLDDLVRNSDYRKYDDGLRMTLDCDPALADEIETMLRRAQEDGIARVGIHRQAAALMTCFTPSVYRRDHIHFVDGASGGYAAAAAALKGSAGEPV